MIALKTKSKTLSLNRTANPNATAKMALTRGKTMYKPAQRKQRAKSVAQISAAKEKAERALGMEHAQKWLSRSFPRIFDVNNVVPLEVGIRERILAEHKKAGGSETLGFGINPIKRYLRKWTNRASYIKKLTDTDLYRRSINGTIAGEVTDHQADVAKKTLDKIKQQQKKRKEKQSHR